MHTLRSICLLLCWSQPKIRIITLILQAYEHRVGKNEVAMYWHHCLMIRVFMLLQLQTDCVPGKKSATATLGE